MIEGHGDDSYKFERPITVNFSSNVYNRVDLSGLQAHLCSCISGISSYPEPEPSSYEPSSPPESSPSDRQSAAPVLLK